MEVTKLNLDSLSERELIQIEGGKLSHLFYDLFYLVGKGAKWAYENAPYRYYWER